MTQRISIDPDPPTGGQGMDVCYDFDGSGITETTLTIRYSPPGVGGPTTVTVKVGANCKKVTVPVGATSLTIEDGEGVSDSFGSEVL